MSYTPEIIVRDDIAELSRSAAEFFVSMARESIRLRGRFAVALSGGSAPRSLYQLLAADEFNKQIDWQHVFFFFGDERCVPHDSPESNFRMASETLLEPLAIPDANVFPWRTDVEPDKAAESYEQIIRDFFSEAPPSLDLVLLGLGSDGHTASLFPHTQAVADSKRLAAANWVDKLNTYRLTLTFAAINAASNVMFLVSGADKADALAAALDKGPVDEISARGVRPGSGRLIWLADSAAAARLKP